MVCPSATNFYHCLGVRLPRYCVLAAFSVSLRYMETLSISVITPVYNRADCLARCIESVARQQLPPGVTLEHVVVDDGSTDGTPDLLRRCHGADGVPLVKIFQPRNRGTNAARNAAVNAASGDFVILLDSDDQMLPGAVSRIADAVRRHPGYGHYMFTVDDRADACAGYGATKEFAFEDFLLGRVGGDFVHMLRRQTVASLPFDEELRIFEGVFFMRFYRQAQRVMFVNEVLYHRDRDRADHVTFSLNMVSDTALARKLKALQLMCGFFEADYAATQAGRAIFGANLRKIHGYEVLLGRYAEAAGTAARLSQVGGQPSAAMRGIAALHLGRPAWAVARRLTLLKHRLKGH